MLAARALQFRTSGLVLAVLALPATALGSRPGAPVLVALAVAALCGAAAVLLVVDGPR